jgi:DNA-binding transcriptional regulator GbsR (MarR family)
MSGCLPITKASSKEEKAELKASLERMLSDNKASSEKQVFDEQASVFQGSVSQFLDYALKSKNIQAQCGATVTAVTREPSKEEKRTELQSRIDNAMKDVAEIRAEMNGVDNLSEAEKELLGTERDELTKLIAGWRMEKRRFL